MREAIQGFRHIELVLRDQSILYLHQQPYKVELEVARKKESICKFDGKSCVLLAEKHFQFLEFLIRVCGIKETRHAEVSMVESEELHQE